MEAHTTTEERRGKFQASLTKSKKELTPEEKQLELERKKKIAEDLQKDFDEQLKAFIDDNSYFEEYRKFSPLKKEILVKLFKFVPKNKEGLGYSGVFMVKNEISNEYKPRTVSLSEKIYPIVKVIKTGVAIDDESISSGKIYTVPWNDVIGTSWNPDFLNLMQTFAKKGENGSIANVPADMDQRIPNLEINWERYKFSMPDRVSDETDEDKLVYLIPELKLTSLYEFNK